MIKQIHLYIKGDVIGVGFRAWTKIKAKIIGVKGWIKNVYNKPEIFGPGGGVEAIFQGDEIKIDKIIVEVKNGPPISNVEEVEMFWEKPKEVFEEFEIRK